MDTGIWEPKGFLQEGYASSPGIWEPKGFLREGYANAPLLSIPLAFLRLWLGKPLGEPIQHVPAMEN